MRIFILLVSVFLCFSSYAGETATLPGVTKAIDGLVWNKWETDNFIVLSIDYDYGGRLRNSIEKIKAEVCRKVGIGEVSFPVKCKVVCVPDMATLKRFFSMEGPGFEVREDASGSVSEIAIWIDEESFLDPLLASVCLHDRPTFLREGVSVLLSGPSEVSAAVLASDGSVDFLWGGGDAKPAESAAVCLFVRGEFGREIFSEMLGGTSAEVAVGFPDRSSFEKTFARYLANLKADLKSGKTPDVYLSPIR